MKSVMQLRKTWKISMQAWLGSRRKKSLERKTKQGLVDQNVSTKKFVTTRLSSDILAWPYRFLALVLGQKVSLSNNNICSSDFRSPVAGQVSTVNTSSCPFVISQPLQWSECCDFCSGKMLFQSGADLKINFIQVDIKLSTESYDRNVLT